MTATKGDGQGSPKPPKIKYRREASRYSGDASSSFPLGPVFDGD